MTADKPLLVLILTALTQQPAAMMDAAPGPEATHRSLGFDPSKVLDLASILSPAEYV